MRAAERIENSKTVEGDRGEAAFPVGATGNRIPWSIILVVWAVLSVVGVTQRFLGDANAAVYGPFWRQLLQMAFYWAFWVVATPLIVRLATWIPLQGRARWPGLAAHVALSIVAGLAHIGVLAVAFSAALVDDGAYLARFRLEFWRILAVLFYVEVVVYWAILAVGVIVHSHARMREREVREHVLEAQLSRARLDVLQRQLQPHFLFNALNTIAMLIRTGEQDRAVRMVAGMGDLLRLSLGAGTTREIPLRDELHLTRRYLEVEQFRFSDRLEVAVDASERAMACSVPAFLLQPIVENSIRHGIARSTAARFVGISATCEGGDLEITIEDDGPGLAEGWRGEQDFGIGLKNTAARLAAVFGDRCTLDVGRRASGGVAVQVRLPARSVEEEPAQ